ncbi:MAG: acyltransferase, partial [Ktedonobacteraceae bacterium]|nr:acyltransferase [Ktedonobacteraceae bacterium]
MIPSFASTCLNWLRSILESRQKSNIDVLDGVRALACLCVVTLHISLITTHDITLWSPGDMPPVIAAVAMAGDTGITLFFILSGFLLFLPYAKALLFEQGDWPSMRRFYLRRALRILPAYYLSLVLMVVIYRHQYLGLDHLPQWAAFLTLFMDSFSGTYKQINGPFWTLAVEWQFYLLLPWLALGMSLLVRRGATLAQRIRRLLLCLGVLIVWGIFTRFAGSYFSGNPSVSWLLPRQVLNGIISLFYGAQIPGIHGKFLEDFAVGMLVCTGYTLARHLPADSGYNRWLSRLAPWGFAGSLLWLLLMAMWKYSQEAIGTWPLLDLFGSMYDYLSEFGFALGYGLLMAGVLFGPVALKRVVGWTGLRWFGAISYGVYMWHLLLLESFTGLVVEHLQGWPPPLLYSLYWG